MAIALLPVVLAIVVLAVKTLLVSRPRVADVGVFATAVLGLLALLAIVGYHYELKYETYFHSARYLFVLLPLGALAVAAAARGAGRRFGPAFGAFVVVIAMALTVFGQLATLERYYPERPPREQAAPASSATTAEPARRPRTRPRRRRCREGRDPRDAHRAVAVPRRVRAGRGP